MRDLARQLYCDEDAATIAEYAIIAAALALPTLAAGVALLQTLYNLLTNTGTNLTNLGQNPP